MDLFLATVRHEMTVSPCPLAGGSWKLRSVLQLSVVLLTSHGFDVTAAEVRLGLAKEDRAGEWVDGGPVPSDGSA